MLNVLSVCLLGCDPGARARASKSIERQGFVPAESFQWQGGALEAWAHPSQSAVENSIIRTPVGFACCVGPLWYRGRFGCAALRLLLDDVDERSGVDAKELRGNFAVFVCKGEHCILMNDGLGLVRLYGSPDKLFYSTSWLATCAYAGHVELDEEAAAEYVLLGASHSDATVARGVTTLPLRHAFDLMQRRAVPRFAASTWSGTQAPASFEGAAAEADANLRTLCTEIAAAFHGRVCVALSGGFDSRLIVAGLLACGVRPELFVYGGSDSEDIPIARLVADSVGIPLQVIDKSELNRGLATPDLEHLVQSALFFDGLPNDGLHDSGADQQTRLASMAGGRLAPNGGGGEIFRNFFHLPDRPFRPIDVVRTFYRGFDPRAFRRRGGLRVYQDRLVSSMERKLGIDPADARRRLERQQVELLFPLFRCHHWMAVNNSIAVRHGNYVTPLVDLNLVRFACGLPLAWKNAGRLESHMIARLHPSIANQPSAYGFRFADGPDRKARYNEWATCMRPVFARPAVNAARRRLRPAAMTRGRLAHCRSLLPGEWRMDPVLDLTRLPDAYAVARALAVEVAWREVLA